jgi:hypothetical protein
MTGEKAMNEKRVNFFAISIRKIQIIGLMLATSLMSGCASFYVDTMLKDLKPEQMVKIETPKPVQLLFEFQTRGAPNSRATGLLKDDVLGHVKASGLFSEVGAEPAIGGAVLSLTIDNVPITQDAAARGFVTGLTFGLAGNTVTDGYIGTVVYVTGTGPEKITRTVRHAIHTALGAQSAPQNAIPSESIEAAVRIMVRQVVMNALNDMASDSKFK